MAKSLNEYMQSSGLQNVLSQRSSVLNYDPRYQNQINSVLSNMYSTISNSSLPDAQKDAALNKAFSDYGQSINYAAGVSQSNFLGNLQTPNVSNIIQSSQPTVMMSNGQYVQKGSQNYNNMISQGATETQATDAQKSGTVQNATSTQGNTSYYGGATATSQPGSQATSQTNNQGTVNAASAGHSDTDTSNTGNVDPFAGELTQQQAQQQAAGLNPTQNQPSASTSTVKQTGAAGDVQPTSGYNINSRDEQINPYGNTSSNGGAAGQTGSGAAGDVQPTTGYNINSRGEEINPYGQNTTAQGTTLPPSNGGDMDWDAFAKAHPGLSPDELNLIKQFTNSYQGASNDVPAILDEFKKMKDNTIDPYEHGLVNAAMSDITNSQNQLANARKIELEQETTKAGEDIRNTQKNLENQGGTFTGEAVRQLGAKSAYAPEGSAQQSSIPNQNGNMEGLVNQNNRLMSTSSSSRYQENLRNLGRQAENQLGTAQAQSAMPGSNSTMFAGGIAQENSTLGQQYNQLQASGLNGIIGNYRAKRQGLLTNPSTPLTTTNLQ